MSLRDDLLLKYLRYANYAEALRAMAECESDAGARCTLTTAAESYGKRAASLLSILRTRAHLAA